MINKIKKYQINILSYSFSIDVISKNPLFSGSFFMIIGSNFANFIAYLYHLIFGRILGPSDYGELVTSISIIMLIVSSFSFLSTVIVKFISSAKTSEIPSILAWFKKKTLRIALPVSFLVLVATPLISSYTKLPIAIVLLFPGLIFLSIFLLIYKAFLQGVLKFKEVAILSNVELASRFVLGLVLIYLNFKVFGALLGMLLAGTISIFMTRHFLKDINFINKQKSNITWKKVLVYAFPVFVVSFSFTSLLTFDLVLVKHFFSSHDAGIYGSVSNMGKIIFYGSAPIGTVMFPIVAKKKSAGTRFANVFLLSAVLVIGVGFFVLAVYSLFPKLAITVLYGDKYAEGSKYLIWMSGYYIFYSLASLMSSFLLSIEKTRPLFFLPLFALLQVLLIYLFHDNFVQIIISSSVSISLLLSYLAIYFVYAKRKHHK